MNVGEKIYRAEQEGEFYCVVCDEYVSLEGASGYDDVRGKILRHKSKVHE